MKVLVLLHGLAIIAVMSAMIVNQGRAKLTPASQLYEKILNSKRYMKIAQNLYKQSDSDASSASASQRTAETLQLLASKIPELGPAYTHLQSDTESPDIIFQVWSDLHSAMHASKTTHTTSVATLTASLRTAEAALEALQTSISVKTLAITATKGDIDDAKETLKTAQATVTSRQSNLDEQNKVLSSIVARCEASQAQFTKDISEHDASLKDIAAAKKLLTDSTITGSTLNMIKKACHPHYKVSPQLAELSSLATTASSSTPSIKSASAKRLLGLLDDIVKGIESSRRAYVADKTKDASQCSVDKDSVNALITTLNDEITVANAVVTKSETEINALESKLNTLNSELNALSAQIVAKTNAVKDARHALDRVQHDFNEYVAMFDAAKHVLRSILQGVEASSTALNSCDESDIHCARCSHNSQCDDGVYCNGVETCGSDGICQSDQAPVCGATFNCNEYTMQCGCEGAVRNTSSSRMVSSEFVPATARVFEPNPESSSSSMATSNDYSYCLWIKPLSESLSYSNVFARTAPTVPGHWPQSPGLWLSPENHLFAVFSSSESATSHGTVAWSTNALPLNHWSHVCVTHSTSQGHASVYVNDANGDFVSGNRHYTPHAGTNFGSSFYASVPDLNGASIEAADVIVKDLEFYAAPISAMEGACVAQDGF